ncbi:hypothetical protein RRG08_067238 [Elysia crispata]|uniref:Uncharacterized protein n=1 Tax=Elysia crispata TaxID=231223 RepID=A0AAE0ZIE2_9GAST|nr:hypothetical protein RRG08_067238 [Elysia crispata]
MGPDITLRGMVQRFQTELRKHMRPQVNIRVMAQRFCTVQGTHIHTHGSGHYLERHSSESSDTLENTHTQVRGHTLMGPDITLRGMVQRFQTELRKQVITHGSNIQNKSHGSEILYSPGYTHTHSWVRTLP